MEKEASLKQVVRLIELVVESGWSREEFQRRFIERFGLIRQIVEVIDELGEDQVRAVHPLFYKKDPKTFNHLLSLCQLDSVNPDNFSEEYCPLEPVALDEADWEVYEHHFSGTMNGEVAFSELQKMDYRLLNGSRRAMEFLAVHPDIQTHHPLIITARWQNPEGEWFMPIAGRDGVKRDLRLSWLDEDFDLNYGWLVLRRKVQRGENAK